MRLNLRVRLRTRRADEGELCYQLGKAIAAAWTGTARRLESQGSPNLKSDNWNNPRDFN